jgi:hypothetical protein
MNSVPPSDGHQRAYEAVLEAPPLGTFVATAYVEAGGNRYWGETEGIVGPVDRNLVFRVRPRAVDRLYVRDVPVDNVNARAGSSDITLDDMLGDQQGKYSLAELQRQGVGCVVGRGALPAGRLVGIRTRRRRWQGLRQQRLVRRRPAAFGRCPHRAGVGP